MDNNISLGKEKTIVERPKLKLNIRKKKRDDRKRSLSLFSGKTDNSSRTTNLKINNRNLCDPIPNKVNNVEKAPFLSHKNFKTGKDLKTDSFEKTNVSNKRKLESVSEVN